MNTRSIHFRLISLYTALIVTVCLAFGIYTYNGLNYYLKDSMDKLMKRRTAAIGRGVNAVYKDKGEAYIANEIDTIFSPEENNRLIRITDENGRLIYTSSMPHNESFNPAEIPPLKESFTSPVKRDFKLSKDIKLITLTSHWQAPQGKILTIEVGETTEANHDTLRTLLLELIIGLPCIIFLAIIGGYILVRKSLRPVENIRAAAEKISLNNLKERLPVVNSGDSIEYLSLTLNKMIQRLDSAYQQSNRFSADASHELRTPLTVMRGELELIMTEPALTSELQDRLGTVLEEIERLAIITEGLFAISRLDAGEARMQVSRIDLASLAKTTLEQMRLLADEKNIDVTFDGASKVEIEGDAARLKQVVVNLLDNAIKYTPENGKIYLKVYATNTKAIIEIADSGIGITISDKEKIFERFYRADKVRSRDLGGAGLGLSIVQSICSAHHGIIRVESNEGKGSRFIVELPLTFV